MEKTYTLCRFASCLERGRAWGPRGCRCGGRCELGCRARGSACGWRGRPWLRWTVETGVFTLDSYSRIYKYIYMYGQRERHTHAHAHAHTEVSQKKLLDRPALTFSERREAMHVFLHSPSMPTHPTPKSKNR